MSITQWAIRHGVSHVALAELREMMGVDSTPDLEPQVGKSEAAVQANTRLAAAQAGAILWRCNTGALKDENGRMVRFGICNDTPQLNRKLKGSDLIGITPVIITDDMVGNTVGVFTAIEVKKEGWVYSPADKRVAAQLAFGKLVMSKGGIFSFISDPSKLEGVLHDFKIAKQRKIT